MPRIVMIALLASLLGTAGFAQETKPTATKPSRDLEPTYANLSYGPHARNVMDVWLTKSAKPQTVLVSIHGGGFEKGEKTIDRDLLKR
jgi:acetyl esterase